MAVGFDFALPERAEGLSREALRTALELARDAGVGARRHLAERGDTESTLSFKGRRELVTAADRAAEETIVRGLHAAFPEHGILAEEGVLTEAGVVDRESRYVWVVDPIDGTTNFVHGHAHWAISLGLFRDGEPWLGVVHAPCLGGEAGGRFYYGGVDVGAFCNGEEVHVSATRDLRDALVATGFSYQRNEPGVNTNVENFSRVLMEVRDLRRDGSAALDLCMVASGVFDAYWEMHLQPYDVGAGIALVRGAGGDVRDLGSGCELGSGREILASNGRIADAMLPLLTGLAPEDAEDGAGGTPSS